MNRVVKIGGTVVFTYPEFLKCVEYWQANYHGNKEYYEACIYGRQLNIYDHHVAICHTPDMKHILKQYGFSNFVHVPETEQQYSALRMVKLSETCTKEDILRESVFGVGQNG